jgi:hypothetical protein
MKALSVLISLIPFLIILFFVNYYEYVRVSLMFLKLWDATVCEEVRSGKYELPLMINEKLNCT